MTENGHIPRIYTAEQSEQARELEDAVYRGMTHAINDAVNKVHMVISSDPKQGFFRETLPQLLYTNARLLEENNRLRRIEMFLALPTDFASPEEYMVYLQEKEEAEFGDDEEEPEPPKRKRKQNGR